MTQPRFAPSLSIVLTGSGGAGVMTAGQTLLDAATSCGLYGLMTRSTGPQIRGGEAAAMIRLSSRPVQCPGDRFDILLALDFDNVQRFAAELPLDAGSLIIADSGAGDLPDFLKASQAATAWLPMAKLAKSVKGGRVSMVALGALARLIGLPESSIVEAVAASIGRKKPEAVASSEQAVLLGAANAPEAKAPQLSLSGAAPGARWSITGNEATGFGAIRGGVKFVGGYPITPATEILEWMAHTLPQCGGVLMQAEDELASINMVIGASFGGAPALTATAGPGLSLMTESLALIWEDVKRLGSATVIAVFEEYFRQFPPYEHDEYLRIVARRTLYARAWSQLLADCPLVLTPFLPDPFFGPDADAGGEDGVRAVLGAAFWSTSMNFLGQPAGNVPARLAALDTGPQPIGVQIVGRRWREDLVVDAMAAIEERVGPMAPRLWARTG